MVYLLEQVFRVVWPEEAVPKERGEGLNVYYRGIMSVVGKVFRNILNIDWYIEHLYR